MEFIAETYVLNPLLGHHEVQNWWKMLLGEKYAIPDFLTLNLPYIDNYLIHINTLLMGALYTQYIVIPSFKG